MGADRRESAPSLLEVQDPHRFSVEEHLFALAEGDLIGAGDAHPPPRRIEAPSFWWEEISHHCPYHADDADGERAPKELAQESPTFMLFGHGLLF
jgi:hypothetical protein